MSDFPNDKTKIPIDEATGSFEIKFNIEDGESYKVGIDVSNENYMDFISIIHLSPTNNYMVNNIICTLSPPQGF